MATAYATLEVIPTVRGIRGSIERQVSPPLTTAGRKAGRDAGDAIASGIESRNYETTGRSIASRITAGITAGIKGVTAGFGIATKAASALVVNAGAIATGFGVAAKIVKSFSAATFVSAVALQSVASVGLTKLAGALKLIAAIASRVAREVGQVTAAFLVLQGVVRAASALTNFGRTLAKVTVGASLAIGVVSGLGTAFASLATTVAAAAGAAAAAVTGILAPAVAALKIGFGGLAEAKKAFETPPSGDGGAAQAKAVASAAKQLASAEKGVERAKEDSLKAEEDLTRARQDAQQQIDDLNKALRDNSINEREAALDVRKARQDLAKTLADPKADALERQEAALRVERAELSLIETQERSREEAEEADKANRAGIEGSEGVVAAKERVRDANEALSEAQLQAAEAAKALTEAQNEAAAGPSGGPDPFYAMIGQRMAPMLNAFDALKRAVTDDFSAALIPAFGNIGTLVDGLSPKIAALSGVFGRIGTEISKSLSGPQGVAAFDQMTAASSQFFTALSSAESGLGGFSLGLAQFAATAASTVAGSGSGLNSLLLDLGEKLRNISAEQITAAFDRVQQVFANIGAVVAPLFNLFSTLGGISAAALAPGFAAVGDAIRQATPGLATMAEILMPALGEVMQRLAPLIPALVQAFTPWATMLATIAPPLASVVAHLAPLAPYLLAAATAAKVIGAAMVVWNAATFAGSVAQGVFAAATGRSAATLTGNTIALAAHRVAMIAGTVATQAFGAAMAFATGPIGLIILAVAAIGAALWAFFTKTETGKKWWEAIWGGIKTAVSATWEFLKVAWDGILVGLQWIGDKASWLWTNAIVPAFNGIKSALETVGGVVSWFWNTIVSPAFTAIGNIIAWWWNDFASPMLHNFRVLIGLVGTAISAWWNGIVEPAFRGAGTVISWLWDTVGSPVFENFKTGIGIVGDAFSAFKSNVIDPVFEGVGKAISTAWDTVGSPIFDKFKTGIGAVGDAFGAAGRVIEGAWNKVLETLRPVAHAIGNVLAAVPQSIGPFEVPGADTANALGAKLQAFRGGGLVSGPGTGTSDDIYAKLSNREFVVNALATGKNLPLLEAINSGWTPPPWLLDLMVNGLPGFATGGLVDVQSFLRGEAGKQYQYGGTGNPSWDCSGIVGGAWAKATGKPTGQRYFTTDSDFGSMGWQPGPGGPGDLTIGTNGLSGSSGHMAGRAGELNFESSSGDGVEVGAGAQDPSNFAHQWHWPLGGNPLASGLGTGGAAPGGTGGLGSGGLGSGGSGAGGAGAGAGTSGSTTRPAGTAVPVWVDNWPAGLTTSGTSPSFTGTDPGLSGTAGAPSVTGMSDNTDGAFDQGAAVNAAFDKARAGFADAGAAALKGQLDATPFGGTAEAIQKQVSNLTVVVADVYEAINVWRREQNRTAMPAGSRF